MQEREYNVILHQGVDYDAFWQEMETQGHVSASVPERPIGIVDDRRTMLRQCHYALTDQEAQQLQSDPRVLAVEIPPEQDPGLIALPNATQRGYFSRTFMSASSLNWGMQSCQYPDDSNYDPYSTDSVYNYVLDGTGVDVVIMDTGIEANHPEWQDANGVSRLQMIDWFSASGVSGSQNAAFYTDLYGHGTHCAGTVAGRLYGWAKNARIYAMHTVLSGDPGSNRGISITTAFDCIRGWHLNKPLDPVTGLRRPTVLNMSWGTIRSYEDFDKVTYRGSTYSRSSPDTSLGMVSAGNNAFGARNSTYDVSLGECIDAGIIACKSAGNENNTHDVPGGADYDNSIFEEILSIDFNRRYYMRGGSAYDSRCIYVGAASSTADSGIFRKANFSSTGNLVDIFAPGMNVMSAVSDSNVFFGPTFFYPTDSNFKIKALDGTSMAAPQVAGFAACLLQAYPGAAPQQIKDIIVSFARDRVRTTSYTDYTDTSYARGPGRFLYVGDYLSGRSENSSGGGGSGSINNITVRS